jgi:uncharacterized membrane protein
MALALSPHYSRTVAALAGWDTGGVVLLLLAWLNIATADAAVTQQRAASEDPGRTAVYALVLLTSGSSLLAAVALASGAKSSAHAEAHALIALCVAAVAVSWSLTHTAFTLRYAHLYYREDDEGVGGVEFPGGARPSYFDFAYMAFTIGMTFQVSDVAVSSPQIRRGVLLHATLSFVYSTLILAFVLNLIFGLAG